MYFLGIDGGGTKTKFILCNEKGIIIDSIEESTCHYLQVGLEGVTNVLNKGIDNLCKKVNIRKNEIVYAFAGIPGYGDIESDMDSVNNAVLSAMGDIKYSIGNDGENALIGALCYKDGINIVAGTGSIGFGYNSNLDTTMQCGGWSHSIGSDEGSAYWIAYQLLREFTRQADYRDEKTKLYYKVKDYLKLPDDGEIIKIIIEEWKLDRAKVASLARLVDTLYDEGDIHAIRIIDEAGKELADIVNTLYKQLQFNDIVKVSYTGGVFNMGEKILNALNKYLLPNKMTLTKPSLSPDKGSLLIALKNGGITITDEIINNMK